VTPSVINVICGFIVGPALLSREAAVAMATIPKFARIPEAEKVVR
jgi:hypothetical protein